jgi:p-methyltransferase
MREQNLDCLVISSGEIADDTERYNWDKMNPGWHGFYGWQWARKGKVYYSMDNLLNYVKDERLAPALSRKIDEFNHFAIPQLNGIYIVNYLERLGFSVDAVNCLDKATDRQRFFHLLKKKPSCIVVSTTFHLSPFSLRRVISFIRSHYPEGKIILGGCYIYLQSKYSEMKILKNLFQTIQPDYLIVESEGESTLGELLLAVKEQREPCKINNLFYKNQKGEIIFTGTSKENNPLDPNYIRWSEFEDEVLSSAINIQTSRSCPYECAYCTFPQLMGKYRTKSLDTIKTELGEVSKKPLIKTLIFIDDTLNTSKSRFQEICRSLCQYDFNWYSFLRCQNLDEKTVKLMKSSGCQGVFIGFESGDDKVLKNMNKRTTADQYKRGLELLKKYGIITFGSFILGFPGETQESLQHTYNLIENYGLDFYSLNGWTYFTFSPVHKRCEEFNLSGRMNEWRHYTMSSEQVEVYCKEFCKKIKNPSFMPANTASGEMWSAVYLRERGFSIEKVKKIFGLYREFILLDLVEHENQLTIEKKKNDLISQLAVLLNEEIKYNVNNYREELP